jgi:hypothetical protein
MAKRAFCIRLKRVDRIVVGWLPYRTVEIDGNLLRIVLVEPQSMPLIVGEQLILETPLAAREVLLSGMVDDEVLILEQLDGL